MMFRFDRISVAIYMTRPELTTLADPENFRPFVIVTAGGTRYSIDHPDYIDIPPVPQPEEGEEVGASYVTVYNRGAVARFIVLDNIASIEFKPTSKDA
jgi:hypothetical protein